MAMIRASSCTGRERIGREADPAGRHRPSRGLTGEPERAAHQLVSQRLRNTGEKNTTFRADMP